MSGFAIHTIDSAPQAAKEILRDVKQDLGFVPNLHGTLANAPTVLEGYTTLGRILGHSSLTAFQRQVIALAVSVEADCEYCVSVHSLLAKHLVKVPPSVVNALREGTRIADSSLQTLAEFARALVRERGWVSQATTEQFVAAGFTRQQVLEVVLAVTHVTLSNYVNHITHTPVDAQFSAGAWQRPRKEVA